MKKPRCRTEPTWELFLGNLTVYYTPMRRAVKRMDVHNY